MNAFYNANQTWKSIGSVPITNVVTMAMHVMCVIHSQDHTVVIIPGVL